MSINIAERHKLILAKLEQDGFVTVSNLSEEFNVSSVTIRKDLKLLEELNLLFRSHGKAIPSNPYTKEQSVNEKVKLHKEEKKKNSTKGRPIN
jgi:DeoR family transcriptional regulator of aga operon